VFGFDKETIDQTVDRVKQKAYNHTPKKTNPLNSSSSGDEHRSLSASPDKVLVTKGIVVKIQSAMAEWSERSQLNGYPTLIRASEGEGDENM